MVNLASAKVGATLESLSLWIKGMALEAWSSQIMGAALKAWSLELAAEECRWLTWHLLKFHSS